MKVFDVVELIEDLPEKGLRAGVIGTIVEVYDGPEFEVDFSDDEGVGLALLAIRPEQLRIIRDDTTP